MQAFGELNLPDAELLLVGHIEDLYREHILKAVTGNKLIRAIGSIPHGELQQYYSSASVFVLPSLTDLFGMVSLEAMACGVPVIVTENTGSNDAVCDGENGFIIPIRDSEAIKQKLLWLYYHPEERSEMGKSAYMRSCDYTWDAYGQRIIAVYNKITSM